MLACLRNHEFEENHCSKEIEAFYECTKKWKVSHQLLFVADKCLPYCHCILLNEKHVY